MSVDELVDLITGDLVRETNIFPNQVARAKALIRARINVAIAKERNYSDFRCTQEWHKGFAAALEAHATNRSFFQQTTESDALGVSKIVMRRKKG